MSNSAHFLNLSNGVNSLIKMYFKSTLLIKRFFKKNVGYDRQTLAILTKAILTNGSACC